MWISKYRCFEVWTYVKVEKGKHLGEGKGEGRGRGRGRERGRESGEGEGEGEGEGKGERKGDEKGVWTRGCGSGKTSCVFKWVKQREEVQVLLEVRIKMGRYYATYVSSTLKTVEFPKACNHKL